MPMETAREIQIEEGMILKPAKTEAEKESRRGAKERKLLFSRLSCAGNSIFF